jgi:Trans-aconitate methyltransferase
MNLQKRKPMTDNWNAKNYSQFLDLRTRPTCDLLAAIPDDFQPKTVYDLGCGPGNSTSLLKNRWPHAKVIGIDSSLNMLERAAATYLDITFVQSDIANFSLIEKADCLFANASLQWLDEHETLIPKLFQYLTANGVLAIQMPNNFHTPMHQITVHILQNHTTWKPLLKNLRYSVLTKPFYHLPWYYDLLIKAKAKNLQLWETEYFQEMPNHQAIFDWVKGTALRPILSAMDESNTAQFTKAYIEAIANNYPLQANRKVLMPFKRLFMLGYR